MRKFILVPQWNLSNYFRIHDCVGSMLWNLNLMITKVFLLLADKTFRAYIVDVLWLESFYNYSLWRKILKHHQKKWWKRNISIQWLKGIFQLTYQKISIWEDYNTDGTILKNRLIYIYIYIREKFRCKKL